MTKHRISFVLCSVVLAIALAGCGESGPAINANSSTQPVSTITTVLTSTTVGTTALASTRVAVTAVASTTVVPVVSGEVPAVGCLPAAEGKVTIAQTCISEAGPKQDSDVTVFGRLIIDGKPVPSVKMETNWDFKYVPSGCSGVADSISGVASCTKNISNATKDFKVKIDVKFAYQGKTYNATTSFTTEPKGGVAVQPTAPVVVASNTQAISTTAAPATTNPPLPTATTVPTKAPLPTSTPTPPNPKDSILNVARKAYEGSKDLNPIVLDAPGGNGKFNLELNYYDEVVLTEKGLLTSTFFNFKQKVPRIFSQAPELQMITVKVFTSLQDVKGNSKNDIVIRLGVTRANNATINWENVQDKNLDKVLDDFWLHPALYDAWSKIK